MGEALTMLVGMQLGPGVAVTARLMLKKKMSVMPTGELWSVDDAESGRTQTIKLFAEEFAGAEREARFGREVEAIAKLRSPHIARVVDHGVTPQGNPYVLMDQIEGQTLRDRLLTGEEVSYEKAAEIALQVGRALDAAHARGIIHRNIVPETIFLVEGDALTVKVVDFGFARPFGRDSSDPAAKHVVGQPAYLSPEQIMPAGKIDYRADLWSLAVVVYETLFRRLPFSGTGDSLNRAILAGRFAAPTDIGGTPRLDDWFSRAFSPKPTQRYRSARALTTALREALFRKPPTSQSASPTVRKGISSDELRKRLEADAAKTEQTGNEGLLDGFDEDSDYGLTEQSYFGQLDALKDLDLGADVNLMDEDSELGLATVMFDRSSQPDDAVDETTDDNLLKTREQLAGSGSAGKPPIVSAPRDLDDTKLSAGAFGAGFLGASVSPSADDSTADQLAQILDSTLESAGLADDVRKEVSEAPPDSGPAMAFDGDDDGDHENGGAAISPPANPDVSGSQLVVPLIPSAVDSQPDGDADSETGGSSKSGLLAVLLLGLIGVAGYIWWTEFRNPAAVGEPTTNSPSTRTRGGSSNASPQPSVGAQPSSGAASAAASATASASAGPAPSASGASDVGMSRLTLFCRPDCTSLTLDGGPLGESPLKNLRVKAGNHTLVAVSVAGRRVMSLQLPEGKHITRTVTFTSPKPRNPYGDPGAGSPYD